MNVSPSSRSIMRIERMNYLFGAAMVGIALLVGDRPCVLGVAVGVALTCINFTTLRRLIFRWTASAAAGHVSNRIVLVLPKMIGLMAAVVLVILFLPVSVVGFTIGYSVFVASIAIESIYLAFTPSIDGHPASTNGPPPDEDSDHG